MEFHSRSGVIIINRSLMDNELELRSQAILMSFFNKLGGATTIPYVECWDGSEWFDASHINLNRSALAAAVLPPLTNASVNTLMPTK
jgi:hypothetical protein